MKKILVTGANGQLGNEMRCIAAKQSSFVFDFTDVAELDLTQANDVHLYVRDTQPDYIINCAAYTAVDKAETDPEMCRRINRDAIAYLGEAAHAIGAKVIHVSTDYVFDGTKHTPYVESDPVCPVSEYGRSKLAGEEALQKACPQHVILRTSWLYSPFGNNFVKTMMRLGNERSELGVIFDQIGTPTYAADLANAILQIVTASENGTFHPGIYHYSNEGVCSWFDFAISIHRLSGITSCQVRPLETVDYPTPAARPAYSVLNKKKIKQTYTLTIPHWETGLADCIKRLND